MNRLNARTKTFETLSAARAHALAISTKFPREYVAVINVFGFVWSDRWIVTRRTRLGTFPPGCYTHTYWIGGKEKAFSAAIHTLEMR